jgi:hypothetical protein
MSFVGPEVVTVTAVLYGDIFGLVMTSVSNASKISIEAKPSLAEHGLGRNAQVFQEILLTFPDFDSGFEDLLGRLGL